MIDKRKLINIWPKLLASQEMLLVKNNYHCKKRNHFISY